MNEVWLMEIVGTAIGLFLVFGWFPYVCFQTGYGITKAVGSGFTFKRKHPSDNKTPKKDPIPQRSRKPQKTYTVEEGLSILGMGRPQLKKLIAQRKIKTYKYHGELYLDQGDVDNYDPTPTKSKYSVLTDYSDDYKITNPVDFTT